ncbi:amidohydrolase [candidate division KSB1 bacterium]|nr:MAG: amidohydrolase [candidate division KSB1 bacterium]MBC6948185.1 amidohydrolase [candidate division KSB1 bacterium]MCE7943112.1 amidohydrolase [Chlorobi bacterium CHB1]MDL1874780.1 amidohydrolase [Cytophagia bacterium CHB2]
MKTIALCVRLAITLAMGLSVISCSGEKSVNTKADVLLRNGAIYTVDAARSWAEAAAIAHGRVIYVGANAGAEEFITPQTRVIDLNGKMVLPGFHDSHVHPVSGGIELGQCNLNGLQTQQEIFDAVREYVQKNPALPWIVGGGWDLPIFPNANPTKQQLDQLVSDRPAFLSAADGHSAWVNSKALELAGITAATADPPEGRIERDPLSKEPTGTLRERATDLVSKHIPPLTSADYLAGAKRGLAMANRFGITSLQEASATPEILAAYDSLDRSGELTARVVAAMYVDPAKDEAQIKELKQKRSRYRGKNLRADAVKIFADGVIESRTAAMLAPYLDRPDYRGIPNLEADKFKRLVTALDQEKFQVHIHAIGDRAIRMALDAHEAAQLANGRRDARHHLAHIQLIDPQDIPRFERLGIIANFQSLWAYADTYITELTEPALGPERSRWLYPIGSVMRSGAMIVGGSDWSVSSMNPLDAIQVAVTRRGVDDSTGSAWIPQEIVDLPTMLAAYTINGAYVNHQENETGSIEVGKAADLIVLDRNLFEIPVHEIHNAKVLLALLEGREVHRDSTFVTE